MDPLTRALVLLLGAAACACGPVAGPPADEPAPDPPADRVVTLDAAGLAAADLERGETLSLACQACHYLRPDQGQHLGPNLHRVFGRPAAALPEFAYSDALRAADIVWTPETLDAWLADPTGYVPGSTMAFFGYRSARDRRDLIAYLLEATAADADGSGR